MAKKPVDGIVAKELNKIPQVVTKPQLRMLTLLRKYPQGVNPGFLGDQMWGRPARLPQAWVLPASMVLKALEKKNLAHQKLCDDGFIRWHPTV